MQIVKITDGCMVALFSTRSDRGYDAHRFRDESVLLKGVLQGDIGGAMDEVCKDFLGIRDSGM
jgi:hypothetical protein